MIVKLRTFGKRFIKLLVSVDFHSEATVAEVLAARNRMRAVGKSFVAKFEGGQVEATKHGPLDNLRENHLSIHMWFRLDQPDWRAGYAGAFDHKTEEQLVSFFHDHGLDFVRRSFPRRS
jgi:hypothetical protein